LPNVGPYIYTTFAFLALIGAPYIYIYDISSLRVKIKAAFPQPPATKIYLAGVF